MKFKIHEFLLDCLHYYSNELIKNHIISLRHCLIIPVGPRDVVYFTAEKPGLTTLTEKP